MIAETTGGTLFQIEPEEAYPTDYNQTVDQAKTEQQEKARPALAADVKTWIDSLGLGY